MKTKRRPSAETNTITMAFECPSEVQRRARELVIRGLNAIRYVSLAQLDAEEREIVDAMLSENPGVVEEVSDDEVTDKVAQEIIKRESTPRNRAVAVAGREELRLTIAEHDVLKAAAKYRSLTVSDYVRFVRAGTLGSFADEAPPVDDED